ncbi:ribosomal-protein-alanine N-acetyltransferase [Nocardiopsis sinuspersici]|uniref:Ribosomal-protein-alanine N-acetyltransferase n=2 Tax=Nocardiopsidaceae TaxID=83676 RepID=A0A1V3C4A2_9ACTN|nr:MULTISPECIES: ribosomal protein S18-alanine N-acetyltransferase [Nocardiopsis]OOC55565.1 ribosomal-protein-alanine N-acetyltransferase [Nocardiopsis sinuspersici]
MTETTGVTGVRLREMTDADVPAVMTLERTLFPLDAWSEGMLRGELAEPTRHYVVAASGDAVVGYAGLRFVPPEGDVQTMAVSEQVWGRGVGGALLTELLDQAARRGVTHMFLEVRSDNPRAQRLYERFGFVQIGVRRGYYNGADALVMRRVAGEGSHE